MSCNCCVCRGDAIGKCIEDEMRQYEEAKLGRNDSPSSSSGGFFGRLFGSNKRSEEEPSSGGSEIDWDSCRCSASTTGGRCTCNSPALGGGGG